ncbi:MAG: glutaredoxin family protein [Ktedonobacterales bacterium]
MAKENQHRMTISTTYQTSDKPTVTSDTAQQEIVMYATSWCGDCRRAKRVFAALNVPYREVNIEEHEEAADLVVRINNGARSVPTIVFPDGSVLVEPSNAVLEAKLMELGGKDSDA